MTTPYLPATPLPDEDWLADDPFLLRLLRRRATPAALERLAPRLAALGKAAPRDVDPPARDSDRVPPWLEGGEVAFSPAYATLRRLAREHHVFTDAWHGGSRLTSLALGYLYAQAECGYFCPACMTDGAAYVLQRHAPELARELVPRLVQATPEGALEGAMFLTEATGGSDVGSTRTVARQASDGAWRLTGDKWFCSNVDSDCILTLARMADAPGTAGLGLFLLRPRREGPRDPGFRIARLKDKLGVRSMATGEVELREARADLVVAAPHGFRAMADMVNLSRLYNAVASVAIARRALREGEKNARWRTAFGRPLADQPLFRRALATLRVDVRAALAVTLDAAHQFDLAEAGDDAARRRLRALTPIAKAATARLAVEAASQGCEMLGGNGYVEAWVTPRLLRDAQVLPIWEGTTNVQALDLLRAAGKDRALHALAEDSVRLAPHLRAAWAALLADVEAPRAADAAELRALDWSARAYDLRAAALLHDDALDGDAEARWTHAAHAALRAAPDPEAFLGLVEKGF